MARSRSVSDEEILDATIELMAEIGSSVTLAHVGERVGLSAATVVQRFGTKRNLMLGVVHTWRRRASAMPFQNDGPPVDRLLQGLGTLTEWLQTQKHVANFTAVLHTDLSDPEFREIVVDGYRERHHLIVCVIEEAIKWGQMKPCDADLVARLLLTTVLGAKQYWAIEPQGDLSDWVATCLRTCIAPWLVADDDLVAI